MQIPVISGLLVLIITNLCVCACMCVRVCVCACACSGQGETVISILTDLNGFWTYENREVLLAENQDLSN